MKSTRDYCDAAKAAFLWAVCQSYHTMTANAAFQVRSTDSMVESSGQHCTKGSFNTCSFNPINVYPPKPLIWAANQKTSSPGDEIYGCLPVLCT